MASTPVVPGPGVASQMGPANQAVIVAQVGPEGGWIVNPINPVDQGQTINDAAQPLYVDPTGNPALTAANGTTFRLEPGQSWQLIAGQTTTTSVNSALANHKFTIVVLSPG